MSNYVKKKPVQPVRLPGERWRDIMGHAGVYRVSQFGRMWSVRNNLRTRGSGKRGQYKRFIIHTMTGGKVYKRVHQYVAMAFIKNPHNHKERSIIKTAIRATITIKI